MGDQMDMFRERKIARMPTSSIGKVVAVVDEETIENRAMLELNTYLGRESIAKRIGA